MVRESRAEGRREYVPGLRPVILHLKRDLLELDSASVSGSDSSSGTACSLIVASVEIILTSYAHAQLSNQATNSPLIHNPVFPVDPVPYLSFALSYAIATATFTHLRIHRAADTVRICLHI